MAAIVVPVSMAAVAPRCVTRVVAKLFGYADLATPHATPTFLP